MSVEDRPYRKCFLHYFDIHFLEEYRSRGDITNELINATKIAILCADAIIIPVASFFENDGCRNIIQNIKEETEDYSIYFIGNAVNASEFAQAKIEQYEDVSEQYDIYKKVINEGYYNDLALIRKQRSTTGLIKATWEHNVTSGSLFQEFVSLEKSLPRSFRENACNLHAILNGRAYTPEYVRRALFGEADPAAPYAARVNNIINKTYFSSYLNELESCAVITELQALNSNYVDVHRHHLHIPYNNIVRHLNRKGLLQKITNASYRDIENAKSDPHLAAEVGIAIRRYFRAFDEQNSIIQHTVYNNYGQVGNMGQNFTTYGPSTGQLLLSHDGKKIISPREDTDMTAKFNNFGQAGIIGEDFTNSGTAIGQATQNHIALNWDKIAEEVQLVTSKTSLPADVLQHLKAAVDNRDQGMLTRGLRLANLTRDFLLSFGASLLANLLMLP